MSDKVVPKLRVVRCPKCNQLLPEPPGYELYKCGGCGTLLKGEDYSLLFYNITLFKFVAAKF